MITNHLYTIAKEVVTHMHQTYKYDVLLMTF